MKFKYGYVYHIGSYYLAFLGVTYNLDKFKQAFTKLGYEFFTTDKNVNTWNSYYVFKCVNIMPAFRYSGNNKVWSTTNNIFLVSTFLKSTVKCYDTGRILDDCLTEEDMLILMRNRLLGINLLEMEE